MSYGIVWPAHVQDATSIAADSTATGDFAAANLQNGRVYSRHRSVGASVQYDIDLGSPKLIEVVLAAGVNWLDAATWRIRSSDDPTFVTGVKDSGTISVWATQLSTHISTDPPWGRVARYLVPAPVPTDRYLRINVTNTGGSYAEAGIVDAGELWLPGRTFDFGWSIGRAKVGGDKRHFRYPRTIEHTLHRLTEGDAFSLDAIQAAIGEDERQVLVMPRHDRNDLVRLEMLYCKLARLVRAENVRASTLHLSAALQWQEVSE